jgi:hypothetical protein
MKYTIVDLPLHNEYAAYKWAREQFGKPKGPLGNLPWGEMTWYSVTIHNPLRERFYFLNEQHATWFMLRWS